MPPNSSRRGDRSMVDMLARSWPAGLEPGPREQSANVILCRPSRSTRHRAGGMSRATAPDHRREWASAVSARNRHCSTSPRATDGSEHKQRVVPARPSRTSFGICYRLQQILCLGYEIPFEGHLSVQPLRRAAIMEYLRKCSRTHPRPSAPLPCRARTDPKRIENTFTGLWGASRRYDPRARRSATMTATTTTISR